MFLNQRTLFRGGDGASNSGRLWGRLVVGIGLALEVPGPPPGFVGGLVCEHYQMERIDTLGDMASLVVRGFLVCASHVSGDRWSLARRSSAS